MRTSKKAGAIFSELEITKKNLEEKLQAKGQELQTLQQQLNSPSLDPEKKDELAKKYRDLEFEAKKMQEDSQQEYQRVERKVGEAITKIAAPIVEQLAKEQKLQLVLSDQAIGILSWGDADWMKAFTAEVSKRLDAAEGRPPLLRQACRPSLPRRSPPAAPRSNLGLPAC
ncbi:MAG: OmpH family outer membrane protein [Holophagaceae bacterium]|nr:OmpH family outer membrane protein [Holophagaceae bacterium]